MEITVKYTAGDTFTCTKRQFDPDSGTASEPCGAVIVMHGYHWCAQVCPVCLANYDLGWGLDMTLRPGHGYYPPDTAARVRENIAANGGQYVPTFNR